MANNSPGTAAPIQQASDIKRENVWDVVPANKFDYGRIELLVDIDPYIWIPIIPRLLDWSCDINQPACQAILPVLRSNPVTIKATIPHVSDILSHTDGRDDEWQNVLLYYFVMEIPVEFQCTMLGVLQDFEAGITDELEADWEWRDDVRRLIRNIAAVIGHPAP